MCNYDYSGHGEELTRGEHMSVLRSPPTSTIGDQSSAPGTEYSFGDQVGYASTGDGNYLSKLQEVGLCLMAWCKLMANNKGADGRSR